MSFQSSSVLEMAMCPTTDTFLVTCAWKHDNGIISHITQAGFLNLVTKECFTLTTTCAEQVPHHDCLIKCLSQQEVNKFVKKSCLFIAVDQVSIEIFKPFHIAVIGYADLYGYLPPTMISKNSVAEVLMGLSDWISTYLWTSVATERMAHLIKLGKSLEHFSNSF